MYIPFTRVEHQNLACGGLLSRRTNHGVALVYICQMPRLLSWRLYVCMYACMYVCVCVCMACLQPYKCFPGVPIMASPLYTYAKCLVCSAGGCIYVCIVCVYVCMYVWFATIQSMARICIYITYRMYKRPIRGTLIVYVLQRHITYMHTYKR